MATTLAITNVGNMYKVIINSSTQPIYTSAPMKLSYNTINDTVNVGFVAEDATPYYYTSIPIANLSLGGVVITNQTVFETQVASVFINAGSTAIPTKSDLSFYSKGRAGISLIDIISANNATVKLPIVDASRIDTTHALKLDTGITPANNTIWVVKGKSTLTSTVAGHLMGIDGTSFFFVGIYPSTSKWRFGWGNKSAQSVANADNDFHVFIMYNGSLWIRPASTSMTDASILNIISTVTADVICATPTWTTATRTLWFGSLNASYTSNSCFALSESYIGTITTGVITWQRKYIFNNIYKAYDTLNASNSASWANAINTTPTNPIKQYDSNGSTYCLDNGHTLLQKDGKSFVSVPYVSGVPNTTVTNPSGFATIKNFDGNTSALNYTDCLVRFTNVQFDRSNVTAFNDNARLTSTNYDAANPYDWHITELNRNLFDLFQNTGYKGLKFIKTASNSMQIETATIILEIFAYFTDKVGNYFNMALNYSKDYLLYYFPLWDKNVFTLTDYTTSINKIDAATEGQTDSIAELTSYTGIDNWCGSILAPNGCLYGIPFTNHNVLKLDTANDSISLQPITLIGPDQMKWRGAALAPNGFIYCLPFDNNQIFKINTFNDEQSLFGSFGTAVYKYNSAVLAPNGSIYGIPFNETTILKINPNDDTTSTFGSLAGTGKFGQAILVGNYIYVMPMTYGTILKIDTTNDTITDIAYTNPGAYNYHWWGCAVTKEGVLYGIPYNDTRILKIDTATDTVSYLACDAVVSGENYTGAVLGGDGIIYATAHNKTHFMRIDTTNDSITYFGSYAGNFKYYDGTIAENGSIYFIPMTDVPLLKIRSAFQIDKNICLSRVINNV